jgi:hypothetical protein
VHVQPLVGQEQVLPVTKAKTTSDIPATSQVVCQPHAQAAGAKRARNERSSSGNGSVFGAVQFTEGELQSRVPCRYRPENVARKRYTVKLPTGGAVSMMVGSCTKTADAIGLLWYSSQLPQAVLQVRLHCQQADISIPAIRVSISFFASVSNSVLLMNSSLLLEIHGSISV